MPKGLRRFYGNGDLHFISASCYQRQPLLSTARRRDLFVRVLEQIRERYQFVLLGYVVMPEHFHLLISEPQKVNPSVVIQAIKLSFIRQLFAAARKREARGMTLFENGPPQRFWQRRFYDFNVWSARKRIEKLRYIHRQARAGTKPGSVEVEQLPRLRLRRSRSRACE